MILLQGDDGSRVIPLQEGKVNDIRLEVTAEDGTTKVYVVHAQRLSAKDATLSNLQMASGQLTPPFSSAITDYECNYLPMSVLYSELVPFLLCDTLDL